MKALKDWLDLATPAQRNQLARGAQSSVQYLLHIAAGRKQPGSEVAARIERSSAKLKSQPFPLLRWHISKVCLDCTQRCK